MKTYLERVLDAKWFPEICPTNEEYKFLAKQLHPDLNHNPKAKEAFTHLNELKSAFEKGYEFKDESGEIRSNYLLHRWLGDEKMLVASKSNYDKLIQVAEKDFDKASFSHFMQYIPENLDFKGNELRFDTDQKCIPLSKVIEWLPEEKRNKHTNWIYSRMIEFVSMLELLGVTHAGLNPDSVFVLPETHGIKVVSFYHLCVETVKTINGKYKNYYPQAVFDTKEAGSYIDIATAKKTAICALGDVSGSGVRLRSNPSINQNVLNYFLTSEKDAFKSMKIWREVLQHNFVKEFVVLDS